jgi:hypothetical protein
VSCSINVHLATIRLIDDLQKMEFMTLVQRLFEKTTIEDDDFVSSTYATEMARFIKLCEEMRTKTTFLLDSTFEN